jgi:alkylation response protein AidB-like acyl-CoA dehydrogenase
VGGCRIFDGDQPRLRANGTPVTRIVFFPAEDCEIIDTWHAAGLRGTGSHDYAVTDLFVPAARSLSFREPPVQPGPLYALPTIALFGLCIAAVPLGIARHAIDTLVELAGVKTLTRSRNTLCQHAMVQADVARAEALLRAGRAYLYETLDEAWQVVTAGEMLSVKQRALLWLAATQATGAATQAVDLMFSAGGATSVYASSPLERCLRDIRTAGQHVCVVPFNYEMVGQALLDFDMSTTVLFIDDRSEG